MNKDKEKAIQLIEESDSFMVLACKGKGGAFCISQSKEKQEKMFKAIIGMFVREKSLIPLFEMLTSVARDYLRQKRQPQPFTGEDVIKRCEEGQQGEEAEA